MPKKLHTVYIGLGSNLGDREANITNALHIIEEKIELEQVSSYYETLPAYVQDQPDFINAVARGKTRLTPQEVLTLLKATEKSMGRQVAERYGPRLIDLDVLFYDDLVMQTPTLTIPHPRMAERRFVLVPLTEISPRLVHPVYHAAVTELLSHMPEAFGDIIRIVKQQKD